MKDLFILSLGGSMAFALIWILDRSVSSVMKTSWRRLWWMLLLPAFLAPLKIPIPVSGPVLTALHDYKPSLLLSEALQASNNAKESPEILSADVGPFPVFAVLWLAGAALFLTATAVQTLQASRRWSRLRLNTDPSLLDVLEDCKTEAGITAPIGLVVTDDIDSPALLGWIRPRILLPRKLADDSQRHLLPAVFFHELAHFRNGDIPLNWLFVLVRAVHWFNPFAHLAAQGWNFFREEAADETAIAWMKDSAGQNYGGALLSVLNTQPQRPAPCGALSIVESLATLKRRIIMINHYPSKRPYSALAIGLTALLFYSMMIALVPAQSDDQENAKKQATQSMEGWLKNIDGGAYAASWSSSSVFFKKALSEKQWVTALEGVRKPLGACKERKQLSALYQTEVPLPDGKTMKGQYVIAQFSSSFDNLADAVETVSFEKESDGSWKASGYYIKPR